MSTSSPRTNPAKTPSVPKVADVPSRRSVAWRSLTWPIGAGLVGGLLFGFAQSLYLGWGHHLLLAWRRWLDALSYAGLSNAILWAFVGAILGLVCVVLLLVGGLLPRWVRFVGLGLLLLLAVVRALRSWVVAQDTEMELAKLGLHTWMLGMWGYMLVVTSVGCVAARRPKGWFLRRLRAAGRVLCWGAIGVLGVCLGVQWYERPTLMASTARWKVGSAPPLSRSHRPNILFVVIDTQRVDRLGCYGYDRPTTPRLDAFAEDTAVFENCLSAAVWTLPSHASMFTGLFPSEHGAVYGSTVLDPQFKTMAEMLSRLGYDTVAFSNNIWVSPGCGLDKGFHEFVLPMGLYEARGTSVFFLLDEVLYPKRLVGKWLGTATAQDQGAKYTNQLIERWLAGHAREEPFFLFVNYMEPHSPFRPHLPHRKIFVESEGIDASYRHEWIFERLVEFSLLKRDVIASSDWDLVNDIYDAEVRLMDDFVGELLEIVARHVPIDDMLIIITSDHGENLGNHHLIHHSWSVYDTLAHVPLIVRYPKRLGPGRRKELVQTIDILPTVMDAALGKPVPTPSRFGRSLLPEPGASSVTSTRSTDSAPTSTPERVAVVELVGVASPLLDWAVKLDPQFDRGPFDGIYRAIRKGPWKYIVNPDGREELYNVPQDPGELTDLAQDRRDVTQRMARALRAWLKRTKPYPGLGEGRSMSGLDDEARRRLRHLGYVQ